MQPLGSDALCPDPRPEMKIHLALVLWVLPLPGVLPGAEAQQPPEFVASATDIAINGAGTGGPAIEGTAGASSFERPPVAEKVVDPCLSDDLVSQPSRPNWSAGAATTQCNVLEFDSGWLLTPMGRGVRQSLFPASVRYGLTPRMDLRWGMFGPVTQSGGGASTLHGVTDQCFGITYRFLDQGRWMPALALSYGLKDPHANPAKGFGTGFFDHQLVFIASRDIRRLHFDFNTVGTIVGGPNSKDGAAQFGMVMSLPVTKSLTWLVESDGGPQPGTSDRYGAALTGASWALRPWLVADAGYTRAYTAGTPRSQITAGITFTRRSGFAPLPSGSRLAHWLGR